MALNDTLDQMDLINIFRAFHPKPVEYAFFSSVYGTFSTINHMLEHKTSLNKFKKMKIIPIIISKHNGMKLELNHKKNFWKTHKDMEAK